MNLIEYLEDILSFKDEESKLSVSSILKANSKKGFNEFGKKWETLLLKYFNIFNGAAVEDTNVNSVQSAFSDFKAGDIYVSLKWVSIKRDFKTNLINNFTGDTAWLASNTSFQDLKITGKKDAWLQNQYNKKFKGLKPSSNKFCVMICCYIEKENKSFLNVRLSEVKTGSQILDFCKERLKSAKGKSVRLNTGKPIIGVDLFPMSKEIELELEGESDEITNFKDIIKTEIMKKSFKDKKIFQKSLSSVSTKISKM